MILPRSRQECFSTPIAHLFMHWIAPSLAYVKYHIGEVRMPFNRTFKFSIYFFTKLSVFPSYFFSLDHCPWCWSPPVLRTHAEWESSTSENSVLPQCVLLFLCCLCNSFARGLVSLCINKPHCVWFKTMQTGRFCLNWWIGGFRLKQSTQHINVTSCPEFDPDYSFLLECFDWFDRQSNLIRYAWASSDKGKKRDLQWVLLRQGTFCFKTFPLGDQSQ